MRITPPPPKLSQRLAWMRQRQRQALLYVPDVLPEPDPEASSAFEAELLDALTRPLTAANDVHDEKGRFGTKDGGGAASPDTTPASESPAISPLVWDGKYKAESGFTGKDGREYKLKYDALDGIGSANEVQAFRGKASVGYLDWYGGPPRHDGSNIDGGVIAGVNVKESDQRNGVASALLDFAREVKPEMDVRHSSALTEDGKAWSGAKASASTLTAANDSHDEKGRFATKDGSGSSTPDAAPKGLLEGSGDGSSADNPIKTDDVHIAQEALAKGQFVELDQPRQISTLLDELAKIGQEADAKGEKAPLFNLCNVSVADSNVFCGESAGIPRVEMPQLGGVPLAGSPASGLEANAKGEVNLLPGFVDSLKASGNTVVDGQEQPAYLRASQNELNGVKVAGMLQTLKAGGTIDGVTLVSKDNYIVDGHHRWAAQVAFDAMNGTLGDTTTIPIQRVDTNILDLLGRANAYSKEQGIPQASVRASAARSARRPLPSLRARLLNLRSDGGGSFDEAKHPRDERGRFGSGNSGIGETEQAPVSGTPPAKRDAGGKIIWQPMMTRADADEWAKDSKTQATWYHGTNPGNAALIRTGGFQESLSGRLGPGIYVAANPFMAGYGSEILPVKMNVQNPISTYEFAKLEGSNGDKGRWGSDARAATVADMKRQGYDSISDEHTDGEGYDMSETILFEPHQMVVVDDPAETTKIARYFPNRTASALTAADRIYERDERGRFGTTGGGPERPLPNEPRTPEDQAATAEIIDKLKENGGFTWDPDSGFPTTGYVVATDNKFSGINPDSILEDRQAAHDALKGWLKENVEQLQQPGHMVGGWVDEKNHEVVFDVVEKFDDRDTALAAGRDRDQQSIFHLDSMEEIPTHGTGGRDGGSSTASGHTGWPLDARTRGDPSGLHADGRGVGRDSRPPARQALPDPAARATRRLNRRLRALALRADGFDEAQHPRDERGRFGQGNGGAGETEAPPAAAEAVSPTVANRRLEAELYKVAGNGRTHFSMQGLDPTMHDAMRSAVKNEWSNPDHATVLGGEVDIVRVGVVDSPTTFAQYNHSTGTLTLASQWFGEGNADKLNEALQTNAAERFHVPEACNPEGVIEHEIGHALHMGVSGEPGTSHINYLVTSGLEAQGIRVGVDDAKITKGISRYASTNLEELVAEGYAGYRAGNKDPLVTLVGETLDAKVSERAAQLRGGA